MKIIIIGAGKVGFALATHLSSKTNDITVIDKNQKALDKVEDTLDVLPIKGIGTRTSTLMEAGVSGTDLLIAVTNSDEVNMLCCLTAKKLGALRTIARIRDPQYARELLLIKEDLGLDMVINPEEAAADEIARVLTIPGAIKLENFAKGRVRMVELSIKEDMTIAGMKIKHIADKFNFSVLIGAVIRSGKVIIPNGDFTLEAMDSIYVIGTSAAVYSFCKSVCNKMAKVKNIIIVGGGKIAYYLARLLHEMNIKVKIIEQDEQRCEDLCELLPHTLIINGDGTDSDLLQEEHIEASDGFIALTGRDEDNIIASLVAKEYTKGRVVTKISRSHCYTIVNNVGIDTVINPQNVITDVVLRHVRGNSVEALHRIVGGQGEVVEFVAKATDQVINIPLHKLKLTAGILIATIVRKNAVVIPNGNDMIMASDRVLIISTTNLSDLNQIIDNTPGGFTSELKNSLKKFGHAISV